MACAFITEVILSSFHPHGPDLHSKDGDKCRPGLATEHVCSTNNRSATAAVNVNCSAQIFQAWNAHVQSTCDALSNYNIYQEPEYFGSAKPARLSTCNSYEFGLHERILTMGQSTIYIHTYDITHVTRRKSKYHT